MEGGALLAFLTAALFLLLKNIHLQFCRLSLLLNLFFFVQKDIKFVLPIREKKGVDSTENEEEENGGWLYQANWQLNNVCTYIYTV